MSSQANDSEARDLGVNDKMHAWCSAWEGALTLLLSRLAAGEWGLEQNTATQDASAIEVCIASAGLPGRQWFSWRAADAARLLQLFLGEEVSIAAELDPMQREALEELTRQWCGLAATALKADFGELSFEVTHDPAAAHAGPPAMHWTATDGTQSLAVDLYLDSERESFLRQAAPSAQATATSTTAASIPPSSVRVDEFLRDGNLQLLMDVELPVMLRFGGRQATLREVLDLATGAVLELDREVQEPVELVLNGKLIARGDVVVVDGNYGLRVTEVASPQQRVNSI